MNGERSLDAVTYTGGGGSRVTECELVGCAYELNVLGELDDVCDAVCDVVGGFVGGFVSEGEVVNGVVDGA